MYVYVHVYIYMYLCIHMCVYVYENFRMYHIDIIIVIYDYKEESSHYPH